MNTNKILLAALAGTVTLFLLGFLGYGLALEKFFIENAGTASGVSKGEDMVWWAMILGHIAMGLLLAIIFGRWAGIKTFVTGAKAGAIILVLIAIGYDFIGYGTSNLMNLTGVIGDVVLQAVIGAIAGGVVGLVLGSGKE